MTKRVYIFGDPVEHSKSPAMHGAAYSDLKLDYEYLKLHVTPSELQEEIAILRDPDVVGANITIPHKEAIMPLLDEIDPLAKKFGAVNTVLNRNGKLIGYNTDGPGYIRSLREESHFDVAGKKVALFGAGGAAKAIAFSLAEANVAMLAIADVSREKAVALAQQINGASGFEVAEAAFLAKVAEADLVINATPLGMHPLEDKTALADLSVISARQVYSDIVYVPRNTLFLRNAQSRGAQIHYGYGMLLYQGVLGFELFTGVTLELATIDKMKKTLV